MTILSDMKEVDFHLSRMWQLMDSLKNVLKTAKERLDRIIAELEAIREKKE